MKRQVFFHVAEFQNCIFCFAIEITSSSLPMLLVMLFAQQEKVQTNIKGKTLRSSRSQMFLKITVFKNYIITVKKTPVSYCVFNKLRGLQACIFIKRRLQHRCFLQKFLRTAFFVQHLTVHYTFSKFYVMIEF